MTNKCLFILIGESFRQGRNSSRIRDTVYGYQKQMECTESHNNFINHLKTLNYDVDVVFNTYNTIYENILIKSYQNIIYKNFTNENYEHFRNVVNRSLTIIIENVNLENYDFIFLTRFDIYIKDYLCKIFNPKWNQIMYSHAVYMEYSEPPIIYPFVTDTILFIPKKYFFSFNNNGLEWKGLINNTNNILNHHCWGSLIRNGCLSLEDLNVMIDTLHNPNTDTEINPIYKINSRYENKRWILSGKRYDKLSNTIIECDNNHIYNN
jgi:hypothetical protein